MLPSIWVVFLKQLSDELDKSKLLILQDKDQGPQEGHDHSMGDYTSPVPPSHLKKNGKKNQTSQYSYIKRQNVRGKKANAMLSVTIRRAASRSAKMDRKKLEVEGGSQPFPKPHKHL